MGDRGNIVIVKDDHTPRVYLYSHWGGSELPQTLQNALKKRLRWNAPSYLTRIIFCEMIRGCEDEETGFGIGASIPDNAHLFLVVDVAKQQIRTELPPPEHHSTKYLKDQQTGEWTFTEYCDLTTLPEI
jgi:hypothetical protein